LESVRTPAEERTPQFAAKSPFHGSERPDLTNLIADARRIHQL
jgi:hypothetical protein